jgi:hypothetical protein
MIGLQASRRGIVWLASVLPATLIIAGDVVPAMANKKEQPPVGPVEIRLVFTTGQLLRYDLKLSGQTAWTPQVRGADWGQMATEFTFTLRAKTLRADGACTFDLLGESLHSAGHTAKGKIAVAASRQKSKLKARGKGSLAVSSDRSPLQNPMTLTIGPRGEFRFGTGLIPLAIYMLPHVDHRFWTLLTVAPNKPVAPGDRWDVDFQMPVPGAAGKPLSVKGAWRVLGWQKYGSQDVLAIALAAQLDLKDSNVLLTNGDLVHVAKGSYTAAGKALWDVRSGVLCSATAEQQILLASDLPIPRALRSESKCSLQLVGRQNPPGSK